jgi:hypothetical protein
VKFEVGVGLAEHVGKESAVLKILRFLEEGRAIGEDVGLRGMAVQIDEHFDSLYFFFFMLLEIFNDAHQFWKKLVL